MKIALVVVLMLSAAAAAQAPGVHGGLLVGFSSTTTGQSHLLQVDAFNRGVAFTTRTGSAWPYWGQPYGMVTDTDNRTVIVPVYIDAAGSQAALALWDPRGQTVVGTLWSGPATGPLRGSTGWTLNSDGHPVTLDRLSSPRRLAEYDRFKGAWTYHAIPGSVASFAGIAGFHWDTLNGGYVFAGWSGGGLGKPPAAGPTVLYRTGWDGSGKVDLATDPGALAMFGGERLDSGDWISSSNNNQVAYYKVNAASRVWTPGPATSGHPFADVSAERYAAHGQGFFAVHGGTPGAVVYVDPATVPPTIIPVYTGTASTWPTAPALPLEVTPLFQRDLSTRRTGKARWDLNIRPRSGWLAGRFCVVAAGLQGVAPPIQLPDGREIHLSPDLLTWLTLGWGLPPFIVGNRTMLDLNGEATARIDLTLLGSAANGTVIHFAGVVLDQAAPNGIAWVLEPWAFVVNVLP